MGYYHLPDVGENDNGNLKRHGGGSLFFVSGFYFYMLKISYIVIILYIYSRKQYLKDRKMTKVIHVHLIQGRKNYYFGSIPAIYSVLTADEIGIKQCSLERAGLSKGGVVLNKKAYIMAGELIRSKATKKRQT